VFGVGRSSWLHSKDAVWPRHWPRQLARPICKIRQAREEELWASGCAWQSEGLSSQPRSGFPNAGAVGAAVVHVEYSRASSWLMSRCRLDESKTLASAQTRGQSRLFCFSPGCPVLMHVQGPGWCRPDAAATYQAVAVESRSRPAL
jgi:hypothetical protein